MNFVFHIINIYVFIFTFSCWRAGLESIPHSRGKYTVVAPCRDNAMFWHKLWKENGIPRWSGTIADIRRNTKSKYHNVPKKIKQDEKYLRSLKMAQSFLGNTNQYIRVKWGTTYGDRYSVSNGVKQGGVLSPVLCDIPWYIYGFPRELLYHWCQSCTSGPP